MLVEQIVKIKWHGSNKKYYTSKGFIFTKIGNEFEIGVKDLLPSSDTMVKFICDYCNGKNQNDEKSKWKKQSKLTLHRKNTNKDCCNHKECRSIKMNETKVKNIQTGESLVEKYPQIILEWNHNKNSKSPYEFRPKSNALVWWICEKGHQWKTTISNRANGRNCPFCAGRKIAIDNCLNTTHPEIVKEWNFTRNINISPMEVGFGFNIKVWWICKEGHEWEATVNNRANNYTGCPYCSNKKINSENSLLVTHPDIAKEWSKKNKIFPYEVTYGSKKKVLWLCSECNHEWEAQVYNRTNGRGCPQCFESKGEKRIREYLKLSKIQFTSQKEFEDLIGLGGNLLRFDFVIFNSINEIQILIEYDGDFHYYKVFKNDNHERTLEHDKRKNEYCKNNNIPLLRIPYWEYDRIEEILLKELIKYNLIS